MLAHAKPAADSRSWMFSRCGFRGGRIANLIIDCLNKDIKRHSFTCRYQNLILHISYLEIVQLLYGEHCILIHIAPVSIYTIYFLLRFFPPPTCEGGGDIGNLPSWWRCKPDSHVCICAAGGCSALRCIRLRLDWLQGLKTTTWVSTWAGWVRAGGGKTNRSTVRTAKNDRNESLFFYDSLLPWCCTTYCLKRILFMPRQLGR